MNVCSLPFLLSVMFVSAVLFQLPRAGQRRTVLALGSAGFLATYIPNSLSLVLLLVFLLSGYYCAQALARRPSRLLLTGYLALLITAFAILKKYEFLVFVLPGSIVAHSIAIVGLSYMLFRQIHFMVDSMQGQIENPTLWDYLNYQLSPFTLLAGPIQRYQQFQESWRLQAPVLRDRHELVRTYQRIFIGVIKVGVFSALFLYIHERLLSRFGDSDVSPPTRSLKYLAMFVPLMYCYLFYLYMNFSGYCDIVIGSAKLVGFRLPENFNMPFLARNLLEYWNRWHITLGLWIRDYLFTPLYKTGVERWPRHGSTVAVIAYLIAFLFVGIWHGSTSNFAMYGLLHGIGVSATKLWENTIVRYSGRAGLSRYRASPVIRCIAIFVTFHYACFTLVFFAFDFNRGLQILRIATGIS